MNTYANLFKNKIVVLVTFIGAALIIFSPSTGRIFLSDDYCTLHNIAANNSIWLKTFFRPVGDLTLMWTYKLTGWDPFYFYLTNILLHAANSYLIYLFCLKWYGTERRYVLFSICAGLIFLTYPSHAEPILWAIGRGISLAVFFSLLAMITVISDIKTPVKYILTGILYFIALACYESVLLLPLVLLFLTWQSSRKQVFRVGVVLVVAALLNFVLRYYLTGGLWKAYSGVIFVREAGQYVTTFFKVMMRMFIPPFNNPPLFTAFAVAAYIIIGVILYISRKRIKSDGLYKKTLLLVAVGTFATVLLAMSYGLSTRTSDGDRLMYFPSVFYSLFIAVLAVRLVPTMKMSLLVVAIIIALQTAFLAENQRHWIRASDMAENVVNAIGLSPQRPLYLVNVPSDYQGAYVFRNCLPEALLHYGIDTAGVRIINILQSAEIEKGVTSIVPENNEGGTFIWPQTMLEMRNDSVMAVKSGTDTGMVVNAPAKSFLYWNKNQLVPLK